MPRRWPLLAAWVTVRDKIPDARLVIAPHETRSAHLRSIESWARQQALRIARIDAPGIGPQLDAGSGGFDGALRLEDRRAQESGAYLKFTESGAELVA